MSSLAGRTALVTGVSRPGGIGAAITRRLGADGAGLFLTGWPAPSQPWGEDRQGVEHLRDGLRAEGIKVEFVAADLTDPETPAEIFRTAATTVGPIDIVVANHARNANQSLLELTADELDLSFAVNARATLLLMRYFVEQHHGGEGGRGRDVAASAKGLRQNHSEPRHRRAARPLRRW